MGRHLVGLAAVQDLDQGLALVLVGTLVDDELLAVVALVDRARPGEGAGPAQSVEAGSPEMAFIDPHAQQRPAAAVGRA
ncbi:MAG: hypothetical protein IH891_04105, partial [Planctomycetes bacterium]|nr:hypothetical protein [Planctomycetota bacterium]